jgi:ACS family D-galactonate transporter-like MFS transporter
VTDVLDGARGYYRATGLTERLRAGPMRARNRGWIVVVLLFIFIVINFADKVVIGIAAVPIMQELELGPRQFGLVGSSFFLLFAVSSVATGFLVNRVQTRWVLLAMGFIWALTQFPMIGSVGFETLVTCRIALGAGEGPAHRWRCIPPTSGFPTNCVPFRPPSLCKAGRSVSWWHCRSSIGLLCVGLGIGPLAHSA